MSNDNDKPFWWSLVGAANLNPNLWEPVEPGDTTYTGEMILLYQGWTGTNAGHSTVGREYSRYDPPRIRRKKVKMITWRLCVCLRDHPSSMSRWLKWIQSDKIQEPWCALESQTNPFETVKTLPEGEEP